MKLTPAPRLLLRFIAFWFAAGLEVHAANANRPNIIFIYTDDQADWTVGAYGNPQAHTPNLDRLAAQGARLTNALVTTPVCSAVRASLFTSRYSSETGIYDFIPNPGHKEYTEETGAIGLNAKFVTFPQVLTRAGYATALVGKCHVGDWTNDPTRRYHPTRLGFQYFMGLTGGGTSSINPLLEKDGVERKFEGLTDDILTREGVDFIERNRERPFFLLLAFRSPHGPWLPVAAEDSAPHEGMDPKLPEPQHPDLNVANVKRMMREYLTSVTGVDRNVGTVLAALERLKLVDNSVVIFSADHGYNMGHNGIWHKGNGIWATKKIPTDSENISGKYRPNVYDRSLRVPAIVRWPGHIKPGTVVGETCSSLDWYPTLVALAGAELPKGETIRGRSLLPLLRGEKVAGWNNDFYAEYSMRVYCRTDIRSYRTPQWKLVRDFLNPRLDELYDLEHDPAESKNLIADPRQATRVIIARLDEKIAENLRRNGETLLDKKIVPQE